MLYHIQGICPRTDIRLGRCGFSIQLHPAWETLVAKSGLNQELINQLIKSMGRNWLDSCGFDRLYDPDIDLTERWDLEKYGQPIKYGPNSKPLYDTHCIRITWGKWGPEHIHVPGDACELDISSGFGSIPCGRTLEPHNIDNTDQVILFLTIFTSIAEYMLLDIHVEKCIKLEL